MKSIQKNKYLFIGGVFGIALTTLAIASIGTIEANTVAFISQEESVKTSDAFLGQYQQLDCSTIVHDIKNAQLALSGPGLSSAQNLQLTFGQVNGKGTWEKLRPKEIARSEMVRFSPGDEKTVLFTFTEAIEATDLCPNPDDMAYMRLVGVTEEGLYIHGSLSDSYAGPLYSCVLDNGLPCTGTIIDMAFSLFTMPNTAPEIQIAESFNAIEAEELTFKLSATDAEGDSVTWGSGNLPEGATLDSDTGVFAWTPSSDQVKDYKITFVATDDGGPTQESSSATVFVAVTEVETPPESNELLEETIIALEFEKKIENSYIANVKNVEIFIEREQSQAAINQLEALKQKIEQDYKKEIITETQYIELLGEINQTLANIE